MNKKDISPDHRQQKNHPKEPPPQSTPAQQLDIVRKRCDSPYVTFASRAAAGLSIIPALRSSRRCDRDSIGE
jgi:hypothetical protein